MQNAIHAIMKDTIVVQIADLDIIIMEDCVKAAHLDALVVEDQIIAISVRADIIHIIHIAIQAALEEHTLMDYFAAHAVLLVVHVMEDIVASAIAAIVDTIFFQINA